MAAAAFAGMLNGMGRDRGASLIIDQVILPATATDAERTKIFAWYNVLAGRRACGRRACSPRLPRMLRGLAGVDEIESLRIAMLVYAGIQVAIALVYLRSVAGERSACGSRHASSYRRRAAASSGRSRRSSRSTALAGGFLTADAALVLLLRALRCLARPSSVCSSSARASPTPARTSARPGSRGGSASSTRWCSRTSRRACCS